MAANILDERNSHAHRIMAALYLKHDYDPTTYPHWWYLQDFTASTGATNPGDIDLTWSLGYWAMDDQIALLTRKAIPASDEYVTPWTLYEGEPLNFSEEAYTLEGLDPAGEYAIAAVPYMLPLFGVPQHHGRGEFRFATAKA